MSEQYAIAKNSNGNTIDTDVLSSKKNVKGSRVKSGLTNVGVGLVARFTLGVPSLVLVAANTYSRHKTGKSLFSNIKGKLTTP